LTKQVKEAGKTLAKSIDVEPVDYEKLKGLLPKKLKKMERVELFGERASGLGIKLSYARAEYRDQKDGSVKIKITDTGSIKKLASLAMTAWAAANIQRKSDDGYERTFDYNGHRAYTKYSRSKAAGEIKVLVANRFLVEVTGEDVDMKPVAAALKKINIKKLAKWREEGTNK
jgi:hypothetical protein